MKTSSEIFESILLNENYSRVCRADLTNFPKAYCTQPKKVKAIVLGADPSNPSDKTFEYVFGLEQGDQSPYFKSILSNLKVLELNLDNIYVQNLCRNYFTTVTDDNSFYNQIASKYWLPSIVEELGSQFSKNIPVFVSAWKILEVIVPEISVYKNNKRAVYDKKIIFYETKLQRPVVALYRGGGEYYNLSNEEWKDYVAEIKKLL